MTQRTTVTQKICKKAEMMYVYKHDKLAKRLKLKKNKHLSPKLLLMNDFHASHVPTMC